VLGVLATAREPVAPAMLAEVLNADLGPVRAVQRALPDFLRLREGKLTFDHFSLAEWLIGENGEGLERAGDFAVEREASQARWHAWALGQVSAGNAHRSGYLLRHLAAHLPDMHERADVYQRLLGSFDWIHQRVVRDDFASLSADIENIVDSPAKNTLKAFLFKSFRLLQKYSLQSASQIIGRLSDDPSELISALVLDTKRHLSGASKVGDVNLLIPGSRSLCLRPAGQETIPKHMSSVQILAVLANGHIASGGHDNMIRIWNPTTCSEVCVLSGHTQYINSLIPMEDDRLVSGGADGLIQVWDLKSGQILKTFAACTSGGESQAVVGWSNSSIIGTMDNDGNVRVLDVFGETGVGPVVAASNVQSLCAMRDGSTFACGGMDRTVQLIDAAGNTDLIEIEHGHRIMWVAELKDNRLVFATYVHTQILVFDRSTKHFVHCQGHVGGFGVLLELHDGRIVWGGYDGILRIWNIKLGGEPVLLKGHTKWVYAIAQLPDGRLISSSDDRTIRLWNVETLHSNIAFVADNTITCLALAGDIVVAGCLGDGTVHFLRWASLVGIDGEQLRICRGA